MKNTILSLIAISLSGCSSYANKPLTSYQTQTALLRSGITLQQCRIIVRELVLDTYSCKLLIDELNPYIKKATDIISKIPLNYDFKKNPEQVEQIAELIKRHPKTTETEIIEAFRPNTK